jgi:octaprenyl-diphosphate synthase
MSEGELMQIGKARLLNIKEEDYYKIIRQKTASLIASCCATGACSVSADKDTIERFRLLGEKVGIAFQIKDDLFDYGNTEIGKPVGIDIKEKKMTLPLIHALNKASWLERRKIVNIVKNESEKPAKVQEVIAFVKQSGGIEYATEAMNGYLTEAMTIISTFENSVYKTSLENLVKFTIERDK